MSAINVIKALITLGTVIADAAKKSTAGSAFDFLNFLKTDAPATIVDDVSNIMNALKPDQIEDAVQQVVKKENDLLAGRSLTALSVEEAVQYSTLVDSELTLQTAKLKRAMDADFYSWVLKEGLPDLVATAKVLLPLLV
jgi:hypothetical protein